MAKGLIKYAILKAISTVDATGYQLIKHIESITGHKPSTGTIYPMLKRMESDRWIVGRSDKNKTIYSITKRGKDELRDLEQVKIDQMMKLHQNISLASETFEGHDTLMLLAHQDLMELLGPLFNEIWTSIH
ncbi:MAG: PadR family transcriptional regulator, partial [Candidatus Lokiarchaeota archaeon]|nr:PadR family transcriptional regulator [Candidatus Lokiarchaeota archaeon]